MVDVIKNNKRISMLIMLSFIAIISVILVITHVTKSSTSVTLGNILLTDIEVNGEGLYTYSANISVEKDTVDIANIEITFKDKTNKKMITLIGYVDQEIEKGEQVKVTASTDYDLSNYKSITYVINYKEKVTEPITEAPEIPDEDGGEE